MPRKGTVSYRSLECRTQPAIDLLERYALLLVLGVLGSGTRLKLRENCLGILRSIIPKASHHERLCSIAPIWHKENMTGDH